MKYMFCGVKNGTGVLQNKEEMYIKIIIFAL
jgi:hypothetical protein